MSQSGNVPDTKQEITRGAGADDVAKLASALSDPPTLDQLQQAYVRAMVAAEQGNKSRAARRLGVSRWTLYRLLSREAA